jgi:hypothetical protein
VNERLFLSNEDEALNIFLIGTLHRNFGRAKLYHPPASKKSMKRHAANPWFLVSPRRPARVPGGAEATARDYKDQKSITRRPAVMLFARPLRGE